MNADKFRAVSIGNLKIIFCKSLIKTARSYFFLILVFVIFILIILVTFLPSCQNANFFNGFLNESPAPITQVSKSPLKENETENKSDLSQAETESEQDQLYLFDYTKIKTNLTQSTDAVIRNCNLYQDIYGDIIILGEILNNSNTPKTNMELTFDFYDRFQNRMDSGTLAAYADYLQPSSVLPFCFIYSNKTIYIDIDEVEIGINYKDYNKNFEGFPVVSNEAFFYDGDIMTINGSIFNIGKSAIEHLELIAIFYNLKNQVVFLRECYLERDNLEVQEKLNFSLRLLLDEYVQPFTHCRFEVFFRDSLKV